MGIVHAHRGRTAPAIILAVLMALAVIVTLGIVAGPASAQATFDGTCDACHTLASTHGNHTTSGQCATCHTDYPTSYTVTPGSCASCHNTDATVTAHVGAGQTCTGSGCHAAAPVVATTTMTIKAPASVKVKKAAKFSGKAGPLPALAGAKVAFKVERKVGKKWVKMKTGSAKVNATTGAYAWSYKTAKKGAHRVTASIAKTSTFTAKKLVKNFKVK
jgi:hypothetical protein